MFVSPAPERLANEIIENVPYAKGAVDEVTLQRYRRSLAQIPALDEVDRVAMGRILFGLGKFSDFDRYAADTLSLFPGARTLAELHIGRLTQALLHDDTRTVMRTLEEWFTEDRRNENPVVFRYGVDASYYQGRRFDFKRPQAFLVEVRVGLTYAISLGDMVGFGSLLDVEEREADIAEAWIALVHEKASFGELTGGVRDMLSGVFAEDDLQYLAGTPVMSAGEVAENAVKGQELKYLFDPVLGAQ